MTTPESSSPVGDPAEIARLRAQIAELEDKLSDIEKLAKVLSLEDAVQNAERRESEIQQRLRWFLVIATLRVEAAVNKATPGLVQKVCDVAAKNLARAEQAEAQIAALTEAMREIATLDPHYAEVNQVIERAKARLLSVGIDVDDERCCAPVDTVPIPADRISAKSASKQLLACANGHVWSCPDCVFHNGEWRWICDCGELERDFPSPEAEGWIGESVEPTQKADAVDPQGGSTPDGPSAPHSSFRDPAGETR